jgi:hypothetical protein
VRLPRRYWNAWTAAVLVGGLGCGGKAVETEGVVTLDGRPVEAAVVRFLPEQRGGTPATGLTGKDGTFRLSSPHEGGVWPGDYRVVVVKYDMTRKTPRKMPSLLPEVYAAKATTPLRCTIPHDGPVRLHLHSGGKP